MAPASGIALAEDGAEWDGLFARVGSELQTLAEAVNGLQRFLTPLVQDVIARDPAAITQLQDLDLLEQSLQSLSEFMACLDASTTLTDLVALSTGVRTIRLSGIARRLSPIAPVREPGLEASDLDLF